MSRAVSKLALAAAAFGALSAPVLAADWNDDFRGSYPTEWEMEDDTIDFEIGIRYWYAFGSQSIAGFGDSYSSADQSHIGEAHLRIDDNATSTYFKTFAGYAGKITGTYTTPSGTNPTQGGIIGYAQYDLGWMPMGDDRFRVGALLGYQYWNDSPDMGRYNYTTASGGDSNPNLLEAQSLRIGLTGKFEVTDMFDITADLAAVPYSHLYGTFGAHEVPDMMIGPDLYTKGSPTEVDGRLFGGQADVMFGVHPTENMTVRVGGRAWWLTGPVDASWDMRLVSDPSQGQRFIGKLSDFTLFRYGGLAEVTWRF